MLVKAPFNDLTGSILGAAIEVHRELGPGLLESTYLECLHYELSERRMRFNAQRPIPIVYKGVTLAAAYCVDLVIEDLIVTEVKAVDKLLPVHEAQL